MELWKENAQVSSSFDDLLNKWLLFLKIGLQVKDASCIAVCGPSFTLTPRTILCLLALHHQLLCFQTIYFAHLTQIIIGTTLFLYLDPSIRRWLLSLYFYIVISLIIVWCNLTRISLLFVLLHWDLCMIQSATSMTILGRCPSTFA